MTAEQGEAMSLAEAVEIIFKAANIRILELQITRTANDFFEYGRLLRAMHGVKAFTSANSWIKCSERMPEESGHYLVADRNYISEAFFYSNLKQWGIWHHATHWMPLPEPPKE